MEFDVYNSDDIISDNNSVCSSSTNLKMPSFKVHKKVGGIVVLILSIVFILLFYKKIPITGWKLFLIPLVVIIYTQLPDLDSYSSRIRKRTLQFIFGVMIFSSIVALLINVWLVLILLTLTGMLGLQLLNIKHRGPLHTYWFVLIMAAPILFIHWFLFVIALLASSSHIFIDRLFSRTKRKMKKTFGLSETYNINFRF